MTHSSSRNICFSPSMFYRTNTHTHTHDFWGNLFFPPLAGKNTKVLQYRHREVIGRIFVGFCFLGRVEDLGRKKEKKKRQKKKKKEKSRFRNLDVARWRELVEEPPPVGDFNSVIWQIGRVRSCRLSPFDFHPGQRTIFRYRFIMG